MDSFQLGKITMTGLGGPGIAPPNITTLTKSIRITSVDSAWGASDFTILGNAATAPITLTLPAAVSYTGRIYTAKKIDATANSVTINSLGGTVDGTATKVISTQYTSLMFQSDGANWYIVSNN